MIKISQPDIGDQEVTSAIKVLRSGQVAQGEQVEKLESAFARYCGSRYAVALNSGTAAIHCALFGSGIGPGDEVITTPFTFMATLNPILMQGAKPVLVDIELDSYNLSTDLLESAVTKKTKAILPVHLYGQPAEYNAIEKIARKHKLVVIEDACQAVGAEYSGRKCGNLGKAAAFSLYATKNITSGEGGVLTTSDKNVMEAARRFRQHGMSSQYEYVHLGYNYRMTDLQAAIALVQLKKIAQINKTRQANAQLYDELLANIPGVILPVVKPNRSHVFHQYTIRVTQDFPLSRSGLQQALLKQGINTGVYYHKPLHAYQHTAKLGYKVGDFPNAEQAAEQVLALPVHPKLTHREITQVANAIKELSNGR